MTKAIVKTQIRLQQLLTKSEAGQGTLEYVGMLVIAGIFATGLILAAQHAGLLGKFTDAISKITGPAGP